MQFGAAQKLGMFYLKRLRELKSLTVNIYQCFKLSLTFGKAIRTIKVVFI